MSVFTSRPKLGLAPIVALVILALVAGIANSRRPDPYEQLAAQLGLQMPATTDPYATAYPASVDQPAMGPLAAPAVEQPYPQLQPDVAAASGQYVGIRRESFDFSYSEQRNSQWCWAAAIQMVLAYYGVQVPQEEIVARTFGASPSGELPNQPGSGEQITANLNNWSIDAGGQQYRVMAQVGSGAPPPALLLTELAEQRPVILAYMSGPASGHAVVATAASYTPSAYGPTVQSIVVRDPWPSPEHRATNGRVEYPGAGLARQIANYWIIRVER